MCIFGQFRYPRIWKFSLRCHKIILVTTCKWFELSTLQNGILRFSGFDVLRPQRTHDVRTLGQGDRAAVLSSWEGRLNGIWNEEPMSFIPISDFNIRRGWVLNDKAVSRLLYAPGAPTVGQHLGRPLHVAPPNKE